MLHHKGCDVSARMLQAQETAKSKCKAMLEQQRADLVRQNSQQMVELQGKFREKTIHLEKQIQASEGSAFWVFVGSMMKEACFVTCTNGQTRFLLSSWS